MATSSIFSGSSRFSTDFSQVIDRTVAIASLPLKLYQQQKAKLDTQTSALSSLNTKVVTLQNSVKALENAFGSGAYQTDNGNTTAASVTTGSKPTTGSWKVNVTDLGSTTAFVVAGFPPVTDPNSTVYTSNSTQTLLVDLDPTDGLNNPTSVTLSPAGNTLQNVVDEINKKAGTMVQATIVNVGSTSSPNYQLSIQSRTLGPVDITFQDGATQSTNAAALRGSKAKYNVNGVDITTDSRTVNLAPDVKMDLRATTSTAFTVSVTQSTSSVFTALGNFVSAFNSVSAELDKHRGNKDAPLAGDSILNTVQTTLRQLLSAAAPSGGFNSLTGLGIGFDKTNVLTFDPDTFTKATDGKFDALKTFFGSVSDSGLLKNLNDRLDSLTKSDTGYLSSAISTTRAAADKEDKHISDQQDRIDNLEKQLQAQMAAADATIAMLEQQVTYFTGMFAAMKSNQDSN